MGGIGDCREGRHRRWAPPRDATRNCCERAESHSVALQDRGVRKGDRVVIFLPRSVEAVVALFGTWFAGGVAVIANERLRSQQVHHVVEHSEASCVVTDDRQLRSVPHFPCDRVINVDREAAPASSSSRTPSPVRISRRSSTPPDRPAFPKGSCSATTTFSSGTRIVAGYLNLTERDVILSVLPFSFDYGLNQLLTALFVGGTLVIQRSMFPQRHQPDAAARASHRPGRRPDALGSADRKALALSEDGVPGSPLHHEFRRPGSRERGAVDSGRASSARRSF